MKKLCIIFSLFCVPFLSSSQEQHTINGEVLMLEAIVEGKLDLLINKTDDKHRFFVRDNSNNIIELLNTKSDNGTFLQEYKSVLNKLVTNSEISVENVSYGRYGLKHFIKAYNTNDIRSYSTTAEKAKLETRLSFFGGITNHPFTINTENKFAPFLGGELEIYSLTKTPRHAGYFNVFHALETSDFEHKIIQLSLGYRYRFINKQTFNIYGNITFATYSFSKTSFIIDGNKETLSGSAFDVPFIFGVGSDIRLNDTSFLTIAYNSLFAFFFDNEGNFPVDVALGYKFNI